ncbi:carbohydrate ABC transporter permease [Streptomyces sp. NPDC001661]
MSTIEASRPAARRSRAVRTATTSARGAGKRRTTALCALVLSAVTLATVSPFLWAALSATKPTSVAFADPPRWHYSATLDVFTRLWKETDFAFYVLNTVSVALMSVVATLAIAAPAAYALSRRSGRFTTSVLAAAMVLRAVPVFAIALPFYETANRLGVYDTKLVLTLAFVGLDQPFTVWLLRNFFTAIPREIDEAAMMDGCSRWGMFLRIMLPLMRPGLTTAGIFTFLLAFQVYAIPLVLTDVNTKTAPVFLASQIGQTLPLLQQAAAGIVLLSVPIMLIALVTQRFLVAGMTSGALKG